MRYMLTAWAVAALAFLLAAYLLPGGFKIIANGEFERLGVAMAGALALGIANALVRPIVVLFAFPLTMMTLGLLLFVINGAMLYLATAMVPGRFEITHFGYAVAAAAIISAVNTIAGWFLEK